MRLILRCIAKLFLSIVTVYSTATFAQFSGAYSPLSPSYFSGNTGVGNGVINTSSAPASMVITGSDGSYSPTNITTYFGFEAKKPGIYSFSWSYVTVDCNGPYYDQAKFSYNGTTNLNGSTVQLTDNNGNNTQSGTNSFRSTRGGMFSFQILSVDNICGAATLTISNFIYSLPADETQTSLQLSANRLKSTYALQNSTITNGLTYDCSIFDKNGICISAGGRHNRVNTGDTRSGDGLLIGAYRVSPTVRVGAWVDENLFPSTGVGIRLSNSQPMFGVFGVWNASPTGEGFEARISAGYGNKDLTVTRDVINSSEPGKGTTSLKTQGVSAVVSYNFPVNATWTASPYLGARYTKLTAGSYTEETSDAVTTPLTYSELKQESTTALAGIKLSGRLMSNFGVFGGIGAELDTTNHGNNYSATGVDGLTPIVFNPSTKRLRGSANAGFYLDIDKTQRISLSTVYREEAFQNTNTLSSMLMYTVGF